MLNSSQIKLVQIAVRAAGIQTPGSRKAGLSQDGRYYFLLSQYRQPNGSPVTSCKQLNNSQIEDLLAICEANGWRMPGKPEDFYRVKVAKEADFASFAQQSAIQHLAGDLGWQDYQLGGMLAKMTNDKVCDVAFLTPFEAYKVIEALKAIIERNTGKQFKNLKEIKEDVSSRNSDKQADSGTYALSGLREVKDASNQS